MVHDKIQSLHQMQQHLQQELARLKQMNKLPDFLCVKHKPLTKQDNKAEQVQMQQSVAETVDIDRILASTAELNRQNLDKIKS